MGPHFSPLCPILITLLTLFQAQMPDPKTYRQHFENKHPKNDLPEDLKAVQA